MIITMESLRKLSISFIVILSLSSMIMMMMMKTISSVSVNIHHQHQLQPQLQLQQQQYRFDYHNHQSQSIQSNQIINQKLLNHNNLNHNKTTTTTTTTNSMMMKKYETKINPQIDISLIDFLPEANLFLDETFFNINQHQQRQQQQRKQPSTNQQQSSLKASLINDNKLNESTKLNDVEQENKIIDVRHFTLIESTSSVTLMATYGPFMVKKTINPFSICRNNSKSIDCQQNRLQQKQRLNNNNNNKNNQQQQNNISEQINAYLVTKEVRRSHPVLRVLFYASHLFELRTNYVHLLSNNINVNNNDRNEKTICAVVIVEFHGERLFGTCTPSHNSLNACLAEIIIPALYWPPLDVKTNGGSISAAKQQKSSIAKVFYTITHVHGSEQCNDQNFLTLLASQTSSDSDESISDLFSAENSMNLIHLSDVFLVPFRGSYEEVTNDNVVTVLIPQEAVFPNSKIYIPVKYTYNPEYPISAFSLRVQVKPGLRILGAQLSHPNKLWQLSIELGPGQTSATVTAFLRDSSSLDSQSLMDELMENISQEVYAWLIEITDQVNIGEMNSRIVWKLLYETQMDSYRDANNIIMDSSFEQHYLKRKQQSRQEENFEKESIKLTSLIDIQKDVMQEIIAITNSKELLNTAILNGRQVSRTMRIYQVSAAGHISDITFQCSCQSLDESIIKVSSSCTSVYLDGSEIRGSQNATIRIRYGSYIGQGNFIVWMPQIPLEIRLTDDKLSQIKGWRVHRHVRIGSMNSNSFSSTLNRFSPIDDEMLADQNNDNDDSYWSESYSVANSMAQICQLKFQQSRIEVYTRYFSSDHDSGREESLVNRRHLIHITKIVQNMIRVSDRKILRILRGNIVEGVSTGTTNIEIVSPITGAVIGSKQIEVNSERETITNMKVFLISGIQMEIEPANHENVWLVRTNMVSSLTKQYQEALLEARIDFSDHTSTYLSEISPNDYHLTINTFKGIVDNVTRNNMIENHNKINSFINDIPRIIALMPGQDESIHLTIDSIRSCQKRKSQPLSSSYINVDVNFELPDSLYSLQNDAIHYRRYSASNIHHYNQMGKANEFNKFVNPFFNKKSMINTVNGYHDDNIRFQRHSTTTSSSVINDNVSSITFGFISLMIIIGIAFIIIIIYSVIINRFRNRNSNNATNITTTTILANENEKEKSIKPYLASCLNRHHQNNNFDDYSDDWIWISKQELESEQIAKHHRTPLLNHHHHHHQLLQHRSDDDHLNYCHRNHKQYLRQSNNDNNENGNKIMNITINPGENFLINNNNDNNTHINDVNNDDDDDDVKIVKKSKLNFSITSNNVNNNDTNNNKNTKITQKSFNKTRHIPIPKRHHQLQQQPSSMNNHKNDNNNNNQITRQKLLVPVKPANSSLSNRNNDDNNNDDDVPPPIPPHRTVLTGKKILDRPKQLPLRNVLINPSNQSPNETRKIDHHCMMKILNDKLKESQA